MLMGEYICVKIGLYRPSRSGYDGHLCNKTENRPGHGSPIYMYAAAEIVSGHKSVGRFALIHIHLAF